MSSLRYNVPQLNWLLFNQPQCWWRPLISNRQCSEWWLGAGQGASAGLSASACVISRYRCRCQCSRRRWVYQVRSRSRCRWCQWKRRWGERRVNERKTSTRSESRLAGQAGGSGWAADHRGLDDEVDLGGERQHHLPGPYLIFVIFSPRRQFFVKFFSTQKCWKCLKKREEHRLK